MLSDSGFFMETCVIVISVVRDIELYEKVVKNNHYYTDTQFVLFDNRDKNEGIPFLYNSFLNSYDYSSPEWFLFCHEDWELLQDSRRLIKKLKIDAIYGSCGGYYNEKKNARYIYGQILQTNRDGTHPVKWGLPVYGEKTVDTLDCQCVIVHSLLIAQYGLRFDEYLQFDFYAEEFSVHAKESFGIKTKVARIKCHHYSYGNPGKAFFDSIKYVKEKYKNRKFSYGTTGTPELVKVPVTKDHILSIPCRLKRKLKTINQYFMKRFFS